MANLRDFLGSNIAKDRKKVARAHERVRNCRNDFQHKVSRQLADENQAVAAETLNVKGMMKNRRLSAAITRCRLERSFNQSRVQKLKRKGGRVAKINRWFPSSKRCSCCGAINKELETFGSGMAMRCVRKDARPRPQRQPEHPHRRYCYSQGGGVRLSPWRPRQPCAIAQAAANEVGSLRLQA